jgi:3-oxoadipate enol-lactonase
MPPPPSGEYRSPNGIFYKISGSREPLLLLHGLMVSGEMFDPLVELLQGQFRMVIPDLRGHGRSGHLPGPYDVPGLAGDLEAVLEHAGIESCEVLGYSHGGAVAQQFAYTCPTKVRRLFLVCTYACNVATLRERAEALTGQLLLSFLSPGTLAKIILRFARNEPNGQSEINPEQAKWMIRLMAQNRRAPMKEAARGLLTFDSRPWLAQIKAPTVVVGGAHDTAVPEHHFETLVKGIPGTRGILIQGAGHTLLWTHTAELAQIVRAESTQK